MNIIDKEREPLGETTNRGVMDADEGFENDENVRCDGGANIRRRSPYSHPEKKEDSSTSDNFRTPLTSNRRLGTPSSHRSNRLSTPRKFMNLRAAFSPPKQFTSFISPRHHGRSNSSKKKQNLENRGGVTKENSMNSCFPDYCGPTRLHDACFRAKSSEHILKVIESFTVTSSTTGGEERGSCLQLSTAASTKDDDGKLPLHLLSENKILSDIIMSEDDADSLNSSSPDLRIKSLTDTILKSILDANPTAVLERDSDGFFPFERALVEWIDDWHHTDRRGQLQRMGSANSLGTHLEHSISAVVNTSISVSKAALGPFTKAGRSLHKSGACGSSSQLSSDNDHGIDPDAISGSASNAVPSKGSTDIHADGKFPERQKLEVLPQDTSAFCEARAINGKVKTPNARDSKFPSNVRISSHAEYSLQILSAIAQKLECDTIEEEKTINIELLPRQQSQDVGKVRGSGLSGETRSSITHRLMIDAIAVISDLVKTVLLIDDEEERSRVLAFLIVKRAMLNKMAIGRWLTFMLQSNNKVVSNRAVEYLQLLSSVSEEDQSKKFKSNQPCRDEVPEAVRALEDLVPSMLALDETTMEQAATTPIIRRVLDKMITRPFAVSVVFFDSLFLACLIVSFRGSVSTFLSGQKPETVMTFIYLANATTFYFIVRELGKAISLSTITKRAFWLKFFWGFWNIVDILSIIMALVSEFAIRNNLSDNPTLDESSNGLRGCLAITTGLLWLKVLGLLKTINMQLATFVLAIVQITRDILWFLLILFAAVISFAQMFYTLLLPAYCAEDGQDKNNSECNPAEYYLKVYSILLGDFGTFDREDFYTIFSVVLFVLFSFMVVIVLLNVLIAIVSDSYEKCLLRSQLLFGRARVMLLAELVSFQNLLRKKEHHVAVLEADEEAHTRARRQWWTRHQCRGYTKGGCIFVALCISVLLLLFTAEMAGYVSGNHYGNVKFSFFSLFANVIILVVIIVFLAQGPGGMTDSSRRSDGRFWCCTCWYTNSIQKIMLRLLGTSEETSFAANDVEEWRGRINYIQGEMARISAEATAQTKAEVNALEQEISSADSRIRGEMNALESRLSQRVTAEIKASERRIEKMIREVAKDRCERGRERDERGREI